MEKLKGEKEKNKIGDDRIFVEKYGKIKDEKMNFYFLFLKKIKKSFFY